MFEKKKKLTQTIFKKISAHFEYRLSNLIRVVAIVPLSKSIKKCGYFNQNYGVVADSSQSVFFLSYRIIKSFLNSSKLTSRPRRNAFKPLIIFWRTSSLSTVAFFSPFDVVKVSENHSINENPIFWLKKKHQKISENFYKPIFPKISVKHR